MEEMSWPEIKERITSEVTTVLVPIGSIEQHGPHLPISTDTLIAYSVVERAARKLGNALVSPVIRPGISLHHMDFPGTITLRPETLMQIITDYCTSLAEHGFKKIVLLSTHGGNAPAIAAVTPILDRSISNTSVVFIGDPYSLAKEEGFGDLLGAEGGGHAGRVETSMILADHPDLVDMNKAVKKQLKIPHSQMMFLLSTRGVKSLSEYGVLGDGLAGNKQDGLRLLEDLSDALVKRINDWLGSI